MAKTTNTPDPQPPAPSRGPVIVLAAGSIAVAALVGWALTRTVEPLPPETTTLPPSPIGAPQTATTVVPPASGTTPPATPADEDGVRRIQASELKDLVDRAAVTVLDVRDSIAYTNGHIPGAINIPFARVQSEAPRLPKGKPIVAYCT